MWQSCCKSKEQLGCLLLDQTELEVTHFSANRSQTDPTAAQLAPEDDLIQQIQHLSLASANDQVELAAPNLVVLFPS